MDWDQHLPHVLFAYRATVQESVQDTPFYLLYGRDPRLPTSLDMDVDSPREQMNLCAYTIETTERLREAWQSAQSSIQQAQARQKLYYDSSAKKPQYQLGQRVMVFMPSAKQGKAYKFARLYHGPYRIVELHGTGASVCPVEKPSQTPIRVAFNRLRPCAEELPDTYWPSCRKTPTPIEATRREDNVWTGRLRQRAVEDA